MGIEEQLEFDFVPKLDMYCRNKAQVAYMRQVRDKLYYREPMSKVEFAQLYVELGYASEFAHDWRNKKHGRKEMVSIKDYLGERALSHCGCPSGCCNTTANGRCIHR